MGTVGVNSSNMHREGRGVCFHKSLVKEGHHSITFHAEGVEICCVHGRTCCSGSQRKNPKLCREPRLKRRQKQLGLSQLPSASGPALLLLFHSIFLSHTAFVSSHVMPAYKRAAGKWRVFSWPVVAM